MFTSTHVPEANSSQMAQMDHITSLNTTVSNGQTSQGPPRCHFPLESLSVDPWGSFLYAVLLLGWSLSVSVCLSLLAPSPLLTFPPPHLPFLLLVCPSL